jgi:hypothetical protein
MADARRGAFFAIGTSPASRNMRRKRGSDAPFSGWGMGRLSREALELLRPGVSTYQAFAWPGDRAGNTVTAKWYKECNPQILENHMVGSGV